METEALYLASVCAVVPGLGRAAVRRLLKSFGSARRLFFAEQQELLATKLCTEKQAQVFAANRDPSWPKRIRYFCERTGTRLLPFYDADYPRALLQSSDVPLVLYVQGELLQDDYAVAIVGSRECSAYGVKVAAYFARNLAAQGVSIISGGARGIDTAAHKACLEAGGKTVAVLGCGLDQAYPEENAALFGQIARQGAVISEYAPGMQPLTHNFPARNRIIAGLARGVLVAEARRRSGAIITANIAADENRDVYCVPGNIFDGTSSGCHELLRLGARLVETPQEILEERLLWRQHCGGSACRSAKQQALFVPSEGAIQAKPVAAINGEVSVLGEKILALLAQGSLSLEELTGQSGADLTAVSVELLDLQLAGLVQEEAQGQRYSRL